MKLDENNFFYLYFFFHPPHPLSLLLLLLLFSSIPKILHLQINSSLVERSAQPLRLIQKSAFSLLSH